MDFEDLALFRAVVQCQSITRAARSFGMTQSTASRHLQRLEQRLGYPLLDRSSTPVAPTPRGQRLLQFAEVTLNRFDALLGETRDPQDLRGELRIAASSAPAMGPLGPWLSEFGRCFPAVHTRLSVMGSHAVEREVLAHHVGLGLMGSLPADCCLDALPVSRDRIRLVVPADAVEDEGGTVDPAWLALWSFVVRDEDSATWEIVQQRLREMGVPLPAEPALVVDSAEGQMAAVRAGMGAAFVSEAVLRTEGVHAAIRVFDVEGVDLHRMLYLVSDAAHLMRDPLSFEFRRFVEARSTLGRGNASPSELSRGMVAQR
ncbi:MAG: LysR substrate-binding domain-containing protein [Clostridia bacterium]